MKILQVFDLQSGLFDVLFREERESKPSNYKNKQMSGSERLKSIPHLLDITRLEPLDGVWISTG
jgi:hypothetical protein